MLRFSLRALLLVLFISTPTAADSPLYRCGNVDGSPDGKVNLADVIYLIGHVYLQGEPPSVPELANVDGSIDEELNLSDITRLICQIYLHSCEPLCPPVVEMTDYSCNVGATPLAAGNLRLEVVNRSLHIYHDNAEYQCCLEYQVEFEINGDEITAFEHDIGFECDCICPFELESVLHFLPSGEYTVTLIGIAGDTIGVANATIPTILEISSYEKSDCLTFETTSLLSAGVVYSYANDTLLMTHTDALFNCGFDLAMQIFRVGDTVRIYEGNFIPIDERLKCICYFEVTAAIVGLEPGTYVMEVYTNDWPLGAEPYDMVDQQLFTIP